MIEFFYLNKEMFEKCADSLFSVLRENMQEIAPTGNSYEEDFSVWYPIQERELESGGRHVFVFCENDRVVGYFQYSIYGRVLVMEEMQIRKSHQGKNNIFRKAYGFLFEQLDGKIEYVEAYAHKKNAKSIGVLGKLGLSIAGENSSGKSYHFRGTYKDLLKWYEKN